MKRMFAIPFVSALVGGGVVTAVIAAFGGLGNGGKVITTAQVAPPGPSAGTLQPAGRTPHDVCVPHAPGVVFVTPTIVQKTESPFNLFGGGEAPRRQGQATG